MVHCILCRNVNNRAKSITLHSFPKDENKKREWLEVLNIDSINKSSRVCSLHFKLTDYPHVRKGYQRLKDSAVPSVLDLPVCESDVIIESAVNNEEKPTFETVYIVTNEEESHKTRKRTEKEINSRTKRRSLAGTSRKPRSETKTEKEAEHPFKNVRRLADINLDEVMKSPEETIWCLEVVIDIINDLKTKIKSLQIELNKLRKKIIDLNFTKKNSKDELTPDKADHNSHMKIENQYKDNSDSRQHSLQEINLEVPSSTQKRSFDKSVDDEEPALESTRLDNINMDEIIKSSEKSKLHLEMAMSTVKELRVKAHSLQSEKFRLRRMIEKKMQM